MARLQTVAHVVFVGVGLLLSVSSGGTKELEEYFKWKQIAFASNQYGEIFGCFW